MKFTVVSHACLYIEHEDIKLLIDPWIVGSCYWRSWWNYPEVSKDLINIIKPTHIYITHLHWDHYHGPTLRKFQDLNPIILFPKHFNRRMKQDLIKDFNFSNIRELDHGKKYNLGNNFKIASYQFNPLFIDSSIVIEADNITLLNCNDSKTFGLSLNQIINNHPKIDFAFKSHSTASPLPHCIKDVNVESSDRAPSDYADDFIAFGLATKSKYLIPFASSHIYLHKFSKKFNKYYSDPAYIKRNFDLKVNSKQECKIMVSGSSWSSEAGFCIKNHDFSSFKADINSYYIKNKKKLDAQLDLEFKQKLNKKAFQDYYLSFLKSCSYPIKLLNFKFGFLINEKKSSCKYLCIIDGTKKNTKIILVSSEKDIHKHGLEFFINTPINVFNDCNLKKMHNTYTPSKLLEIVILKKNGLNRLNKYFSLVDLYENNFLPLNQLISIRNIVICLRRFREFIDMIVYFFKIKIQKKKIHTLWHKI